MATFLSVVNTLCRVTMTSGVLYGGYYYGNRLDSHIEGISSSLKSVAMTCETTTKLLEQGINWIDQPENQKSSTQSYRQMGGIL